MEKNRGILQVSLREERDDRPVSGAAVILTGGAGGSMTAISDARGEVSFEVDTPGISPEMTPAPRVRPYTALDIRIVTPGYLTVTVVGEQIFDTQITAQLIEMERTEDHAGQTERVIIIPEHSLYQTREPVAPPAMDAVTTFAADRTRPVVIPENITVHLGPPGATAQNVTVPFIDYIKNVACSEVYPNWPENALIANIIAQVSLALNRIYTEWYRSQGYSFDITNSTAYDQYFVYERGIFDTVSDLVDGYFTTYLAREGRLEPLFAEYCDGATVTCSGLSQWGTVALARKNYTPLQILQYYYGREVGLRNAEVAEVVPGSYPGELSAGAESDAVATLQNRLNRVAIAFPAIPFVLPVDGVFGSGTSQAVRAFQKVFRLPETGVVDQTTWYRLQYIYTAIKKLAELGSEGEFPQTDAFNGNVLQPGSRGNEVLRLEYYLNFISGKLGSSVVPAAGLTGVYDNAARASVTAFQEYYGLAPTGVVNEATWNAVVATYYSLGGGEKEPVREYPGTLLRRGSRGADVLYVQELLNAVSRVDPAVPQIAEDGIFGPATQRAVIAFQRAYGLDADGIVGPLTWNALTAAYAGAVGDEASAEEASAGKTAPDAGRFPDVG